MSVEFLELPPERIDELSYFLRGVFGFKQTPSNLSREAMQWKYFDPHPWWKGSRSYILETNGSIVAHSCVTPVRFLQDNKAVESGVIIDWASGMQVPGSGLLLCRKFIEAGKASLLAIGGSSDALTLLPKVRWFAPKSELRCYAKPLRPMARFIHSRRSMRDFLKMGRNLLWRRWPFLPRSGSWSCRPGRADDPVFNPAGDFVPIIRTREWINYLMACPLAKSSWWILECKGEPQGHALVCNLNGSGRIADFALAGSQSQDEKTFAFSALLRALCGEPELIEVVAGSSLLEETRVFEKCGLRYRGSAPVLLADPRKDLPPKAHLEIKPILGDGFYLQTASAPFWV